MWTMNFQIFKLDLEKAEEPEIKLPTSTGSLKKQESSTKTFTSTLLSMPKPLTMWISKLKAGNILKPMSYIIHCMYKYILKLIIAFECNQDHFGELCFKIDIVSNSLYFFRLYHVHSVVSFWVFSLSKLTYLTSIW